MTIVVPESETGPEVWSEAAEIDVRPEQALSVHVSGFDGPLDLLLALARTHKVDLAKISVLALAEQYLAFIANARSLRIELAGDYLVMAAWLAYLKSRLLLPKEKPDDPTPSGEEMAARLAFRLKRLEAMRQAAAQLMTRKRLGFDIFARGAPEGMRTIRERTHVASIYDLLSAYAAGRSRTAQRRVHIVRKRSVWSIKDARMRLEQLVGATDGTWAQLDLFINQYLTAEDMTRTTLASSFGATLEMAREGLIELQQAEPFAPLFVRKRAPATEGGA